LRSLERKWGSIKHDVSKFVGAYGFTYDNRETDTSLEDVLVHMLELYKDQSQGGTTFIYLHCWVVLRDAPMWMETFDQRSNHAPIVSTEEEPERGGASVPINGGDAASPKIAEGDDDVFAVEVLQKEPIHLTSTPAAKHGRPIGNKAAREELRACVQRDHGVKIREKQASNMANAHFRKAQVLEDQAVLNIFVMPRDEILKTMYASISNCAMRKNC
jgi:hypothetical protein